MKAFRHVVEIVDYDPVWPRAYANEKRRILSAIAHPSLRLEHIGSTAVPGLAAKPIVDILIGVPHLRDAVTCIAGLTALGYHYIPAVEVAMPYRRFLRKQRDGYRTHHVHILEPSHEAWDRHLIFRDHLRSHPKDANDYEQLKRRLARRYRFDIAGYTHGKSEFVWAVLKKAQSQAKSHRRLSYRGFTYEVVLQAIAQGM
jgi:GrpB-like predicted nucleotidyltransferase (UPF0157 family)